MSPDRDPSKRHVARRADSARLGCWRGAWRRRGFSRNEDGAAILEFALVLPLLVALVFGCYEMGRAALIRQTLVTAVQGGARYLARVPNPNCDPACSPGAASAIAMTLNQIAENTGLARTAIRVELIRDPLAESVGMAASVELSIDLAVIPSSATSWTLAAEHREPRIAD